MGLDALLGFPSWETALPRLTPDEVEGRRRWGPAAERLRAWGPRVAEALPRALGRWWPFGAPETRLLRLRLSGPGEEERTLEIDRFPLRIGRSEDCSLPLPHPSVSTEHAEIRLEGGDAFLMDVRSTNGTRRNGQPLTPLVPVPLEAADRIDVGPFALTVLELLPTPVNPSAFALHTTGPRPRSADTAFPLSPPSDRWVRARWAGETCFVRLSAPWIRACWQREAEVPPEEGEIDPMEEGAAQFVLDRVALGLGEELGQPVELSAWLTPQEARQAATGEETWLETDVWISTPTVQAVTSLLFAVGDAPPPRWFAAWGELAWPASLCLGLIRLRLSEWRQVEPGDALLPDVWWPAGWTGAAAPLGDLGPAFLRLQRTWQGGRLLRSGAGVKLRLDQVWLPTPGGGWLMEEDELAGDASSLPIEDLELQVAIELARFPVTVGEIQRWRPGEVVSLRQGPADPVRLVLETGIQRRVLGEGRVVIVNGNLGIEVLRILTQLEDGSREPSA